MSKIVLGIDISKKELSLALLKNEKFSYKTVGNSAKGFQDIIDFVKKFADSCEVYLEATGRYGEAVTDFLYANGFDVKVINPSQINALAKVKLSRHKTDKCDAGIIAEYGSKFGGTSYVPIAENIKELRELYRTSLSLKDDLTAAKNHLENKELQPKSVRELWERRAKDLENDIKNIEKIMKQIINNDPDLKLKFEALIGIIGIGDGTAMAVLAEVTKLDNFKTARQLAAFIGLTPRHRISGTSVRGKPRISKMGLKLLRKALYFPAITAMQFNPQIKFFAEKLISNGKQMKQVICAVMRKLVHIIFGVLKYDVPKLKKSLDS
jgi:transposase